MLKVLSGNRPDITPAQLAATIVAGIPIFANLLHVFGVFDLSHEQSQALQDTITWGGVFAALLMGSDAALRVGRNHADAKVQAAAVSATGEPVAPPAAQLGGEGGELPGEGDIGDIEAGEDLPGDEEEFAGGGPDDDAGPDSRIEPAVESEPGT